ncbi:MAG: L-lactate dehydrogenase, partial [Pseudomonadota bacterium]
GVSEALGVIHKELDLSMGLCGQRDIAKVTRDVLLVPEDFSGRYA